MKLQSAIEYLTTYGWAILIISIVLVALFAIITSSTNPVQECIMPAGFSCPSFYIAQNGMLQMNLLQSSQYPIQVTSIGCTNPQSLSFMTPTNTPSTPNYVAMPIGSNYIFSNIQCYSNHTAFSGVIKSAFSGYIEINYTNTYTGFPNTVYGTLRVEVTK